MLGRLSAILVLVCLTVATVWLRDNGTRSNTSQSITFTPVSLGPPGTRVDRAGALKFAGGWDLYSPNSDFFGFSGLDILPDGRLVSVTDSGSYAIFPKPYANRNGIVIRGIPSISNRGMSKFDRDSESLTVDPASGTIWVGFEGSNSIGRFKPLFSRPDGSIAPKAMESWEDNSGAETLLRLRNGSFMVLEEANPAKGLLFAADPLEHPTNRPIVFKYEAPKGFRPTDGTQLRDGKVIILNRKVTFKLGFEACLTIAAPENIRKNQIWASKPIGCLTAPMTVDNFEGIAAESGENNQIVIWMISDNNSSVLQRTLLLKFILDERAEDPGFTADVGAPPGSRD